MVVALSHPLGLEALPDAEALLDEFHRGVLEAGAPFELWGSWCWAIRLSQLAWNPSSTRAPSVSPCPRAR